MMSQYYSTSILGEVQARGLSPWLARLDRTSLERERLHQNGIEQSLVMLMDIRK